MFKKRKGQALIEFLMITPLILIIIGLMLVGFQLFYDKMIMANAAYEGARIAAAYDTTKTKVDKEIGYNITEATNTAQRLLDATGIGLKGTVLPKVYHETDNRYITCKVSGNVQLMFPWFSSSGLTLEYPLSVQYTLRKEVPISS